MNLHHIYNNIKSIKWVCPPGHNHAVIEAWSSADLGQLVYGYTPNKTYIQNKYLKLIIFKYNIDLHK